MKKLLVVSTLAALLALLYAATAFAGGWAVITLDEMLGDVTVNQPVTVGMTIRQHGQTPWRCDCVRVRGFHQTGDKIEVGAKMDKPGHYTATLNFAKPGKWQWAIASGLMP